MSKEKIVALKIEPHRHPQVVRVAATKQTFLSAINAGADVEGKVATKMLEPQIYALFHDLRCMSGLDGNRRLGKDIIAGTFYVVATDELGYLCSMTEDKIKKYAFQFWEIETISDRDLIDANFDVMFGTDPIFE